MRVDRVCLEYSVRVHYKHFPLHPDTPEEGLTLEQLFAGRSTDISSAQARMHELMRAEGLPYGNRTMTFNSRLAQELAAWAVGQTGGDSIHDALFRAYFVDGMNLAKVENLIEVAESIGLPSVAAQGVLETRECRPAVDADWEQCYRKGITGVPTFAVGNAFLVGAQPDVQLEKLLVSGGAVTRT